MLGKFYYGKRVSISCDCFSFLTRKIRNEVVSLASGEGSGAVDFRSVFSDSLRPHGLQLPRLLCPWNFPGKSTGVGCHFLLQGIFPTQGSNLGLLHCRQTLYPPSYQGSPSQSITELFLLGFCLLILQLKFKENSVPFVTLESFYFSGQRRGSSHYR